jgi:HK97 family phage portal protein
VTELIRSFASLFSKRGLEISIADLDRMMDTSLMGSPSSVGTNVSAGTVLSIPAAYSCISLISRVGGLMPGHVYRRISGSGLKDRERADGHYLYPLIHDRANPTLLASEWRKIALLHLNTYGNHYSWIEWKDNRRAKALWPLPPNKVKAKRDSATSEIRYWVQTKWGEWVEFPAEDIIHIRGLGDGTTGFSPVELFRNTFGLAQANQDSSANLHKSGMTSRLLIKLPGSATEAQQKEARESFSALYEGTGNQFKAIVLQNGMEATPISINPDDAQFLGQMGYTDEKIYQVYGVVPHMVGDTSKATSWGTGIEQLTIGFVTFTMLPWMDLIEETLAMKLLPDDRSHFIEYDFRVLLRGDSKARSDFYRTMIELGVYNPNRVLAAENEEPYEGGNVYRRPLNTAFVDETGKPVMVALPLSKKDAQQEAPTDEQTEDTAV